MTDMLPAGVDELERMKAVVRHHNTDKIKGVLATLEPYVDGSFGPVQPGHVRVYLEALKALGQLWRVYAPVPPPEPVADPELVVVSAERRRRGVLAELEALAVVAGRRLP